jgi:hypothetical protein
MKILYIAGRWDPKIQTEYSGNDFGAYRTLLNEPGVELVLAGPFDFPPGWIERGLAKLYGRLTGKPCSSFRWLTRASAPGRSKKRWTR